MKIGHGIHEWWFALWTLLLMLIALFFVYPK